MPQTEQQKIRARLRSYERKLQQEKKKFGWSSDGGGKRYLIREDLKATQDLLGIRLDVTIDRTGRIEELPE